MHSSSSLFYVTIELFNQTALKKYLQGIRNLGCKSKVSYHSHHLIILFTPFDENILKILHFRKIKHKYTSFGENAVVIRA
jgi:hypothetical protein